MQVDEHLSDVERTNLFLTGGQLVQQRKAIEGWVVPCCCAQQDSQQAACSIKQCQPVFNQHTVEPTF